MELADPETGLLCVGGDLSVDTLLAAYRSGVFPWPLGEGEELYWFAPEQRAVLKFEDLHISRSLAKTRRNTRYTFKLNTDFEEIIGACATTRSVSGQRTWITRRLLEAYLNLERNGFIRCAGCYDGENLVGGIYGVFVDGIFSGESMFHSQTDASKLSLCVLVEHLTQEGVAWMDCQQLTPLLSRFGATLLPRKEFMKLLSSSRVRK